ncbi:MAG: M48 family metallopeptidase [Sphingomonas sp.]
MAGEIEIVRHPRARRMRLSVDPASGRTRLTLPPRAPIKAAMRWAAEQQAWIAAQRARLPEAQPFAPGGSFPLRGRPVTIDWQPDRPRRIELDGEVLRCGGPVDGLARRIETWLRRTALALLAEETALYAARLGVTIEKVAVGDPRGRWGSCSSGGTIRYSWRLILAPDAVRRATVAHEVAHRVHMDHSPRFHRLVETILEEDPAPARRWLRANGAALHWVGRDS